MPFSSLIPRPSSGLGMRLVIFMAIIGVTCYCYCHYLLLTAACPSHIPIQMHIDDTYPHISLTPSHPTPSHTSHLTPHIPHPHISHTGDSSVCNNADGCTGCDKTIHEGANSYLGQERRADIGGYQAVLYPGGEGGMWVRAPLLLVSRLVVIIPGIFSLVDIVWLMMFAD